MDNTTLWLNAANIITSVATLGALIAVAIEIRSSRVADKRNAYFQLLDKHEVVMQQLPILLKTGRKDFIGFFDDYPSGTDERRALGTLINFLEAAGAASIYGLIDKENTIEEFGEWAVGWWNKLSSLIVKQREAGDKTSYLYFEWLVLQTKKRGPQLHNKVMAELKTLRKDYSL
jgi:hypothetical protein